MKDSILNLIGNTPLVRLSDSIFSCPVYAKLEEFNPGGSIKDRAALEMVRFGEKHGLLKSGGTIVEASSGNQGIALAMIGAVRGYKVIITVSEKVSAQKVKTLKAYGAKVVICPNVSDHDDPKGYHQQAKKIAAKIRGAYFPDQYNNPQNPLAHYKSTGPEIWKQTRGKITHLIAAAGTTGTVMGIAKYLKEKNPKIKIIAVDAANSAFSNKNPKPYRTEGLGINRIPKYFKQNLVDQVVAITDREAFFACRQLAKFQGILVGGSSGAAFAAVCKYAKNFNKNDFTVVVFPDSGKPYLDKIF